ncbi:cytochrome c [Dyadobacter sp. CY323]|uniref:c-type cytochrome n=1 Tax=Dyadobacter sp. CY323 TaxID=2907302 RepID=UPI001F1E3ECF|nr:cytochrome c [Dyadobacter sp. CY323]MCE6991419.1 cytochrome c [Dyadobacter sp. CY323]
MNRKTLLITFVLAGFLTACAMRRSEPAKQKMFEPATSQIANGEKIFMAKCQKCHPGGEAGLGIGLNPVPAPKFLKRFQIRHGLGVMPAFKKEEITRQELHDITSYMSAWKHY